MKRAFLLPVPSFLAGWRIIILAKDQMEIGNLEPEMLYKGDVVRIPMETPQRITNIGTMDLLFYAVSSPHFKPDACILLE